MATSYNLITAKVKTVLEALLNLVTQLSLMGFTDANKNIRLIREWEESEGRVKGLFPTSWKFSNRY